MARALPSVPSQLASHAAANGADDQSLHIDLAQAEFAVERRHSIFRTGSVAHPDRRHSREEGGALRHCTRRTRFRNLQVSGSRDQRSDREHRSIDMITCAI